MADDSYTLMILGEGVNEETEATGSVNDQDCRDWFDFRVSHFSFLCPAGAFHSKRYWKADDHQVTKTHIAILYSMTTDTGWREFRGRIVEGGTIFVCELGGRISMFWETRNLIKG
jgi:hypothetical protein